MWSRTGGAVRVAKDAVRAGVTAGWSGVFSVVGRLRRGRTPRWTTRGGARVLVVAPHPDDEVYGCGGTLLRHRAEGDRVVVAVVTDGRRSGTLGLPPGEMAAVRRGEAEEAARELDVELRWLGLREGEWEPDELTPLLARLLDEEPPDVIYAPSRIDFHPEHLRVARSLAVALEQGAGPRERLRVRIYGVQVPLTPRLANLVTPFARHEAAWRAALDRHRSQRGTLRSALRLRRYAGRLHRAGALAEELWEIPTGAYRALHAGDPAQWLGASTPFRGIRPLPFTDPLAFLVGGRERERLRALTLTGSGERDGDGAERDVDDVRRAERERAPGGAAP